MDKDNKKFNKDLINKHTTSEQRIQYLYREVFYISEKITELMEHQKDVHQILLNLVAEYENIKDFQQKFLK